MSGAKDYRLAPVWYTVLADIGLHAADVLRIAGMPEDLLSQPVVRVDAEDFFRLWRAAESLCPGIDLPLAAVRHASAESFTPPLFAALCSPNLAVALERLANYKQLCAPMRIELAWKPDGGRSASLRWLSAADSPPPSLSTMELAFLLKVARMGTRREVCPTAVALPERPANPTAYAAFFGVQLEYGGAGSISFSRETLQIPFLTSNDELWEAFEPNLRQRLATIQSQATTTDRVRAVLLESLPSGRANVADVSSRLGLSARTLQRRLRTEASSFNTVLANVREELARHYLDSTDLPCNEIAFLLGYEEPNSFFRAFHGWTGQSPERHRQTASLQ